MRPTLLALLQCLLWGSELPPVCEREASPDGVETGRLVVRVAAPRPIERGIPSFVPVFGTSKLSRLAGRGMNPGE
jgi:hypothetical protein